ncbi:hypothetical protein LOTGIDRAFT_204781, partial [Lottia gigantea]
MSSPIKQGKEFMFSPVKSPVAELPKGNLTGKPRKLKDGAADVHNAILTWKQLNIQGTSLFNQIANIKLEKVFDESKESDDLPASLEPLCEQLLLLYQTMKKAVMKIKKIIIMINGIIDLSDYQHGESHSEIFFKTWTLHDFVECISELHGMYQEELKLKKCLIENVAHASNRKMLMFYSASWIHQPYITSKAELLLDSLLLETGLK